MSEQRTLSGLLLRFIEAHRDELEREETPDQWVHSMRSGQNPAGKLIKAARLFVATFEHFEGPAADELRSAIEVMTR